MSETFGPDFITVTDEDGNEFDVTGKVKRYA